ncbi:amino-acid N-acetyltransferase [Methylotuvimicrobium alcaliphilum]|uniref:Amino-acid acetyltransferase n=1 Tax=Methylotuvimicrobium alcaliphilum (strain DSM 19304 / NCIMB 14124 / VKM B-2133 / 20Z) TaxID=1091494 RepID=G4T1P8_META2|nr:amino-acid N-acetyltransferase [Methylotuvimicrobium alcaliphilum]CCE23480.1 Amino-acid acetyltransferase [Methylotuvimicrobium alcaliphilum 20Z]
MTDSNLPASSLNHDFVNWFRDSSPYIHAHRNRTFVVSFGGEAVYDSGFAHHVHDFALLNSLGIRLVLVHGIRPQIDTCLRKQNIAPRFHKNLRVTDELALQCVKEAAGLVRVETEALLSMGLANSPMAGAKIRVVSGNFVIAKPIGVIDGVDYGHTGEVRRIDSQAIHQQLDMNSVVLISPVGYSPSGEAFNLSAEKVATEIAIALKAEKLLLLTEQSINHPESGDKIQQMTTVETQQFINRFPDIEQSISLPLQAAIHGCQSGVERVHLVNRHQDGGLLLELFSRDGTGTLISSTPYEELRPATLNDIGGILELIIPLEEQGILVKRSREKLEMEIGDYIIIERDGLIIGCTALHSIENEHAGMIACLAVHPDYRGSARAGRLLEHLQHKAKMLGMQQIFALTTQTSHWFLERGFAPSAIETLPEQLKSIYNPQRKSKILCKSI